MIKSKVGVLNSDLPHIKFYFCIKMQDLIMVRHALE